MKNKKTVRMRHDLNYLERGEYLLFEVLDNATGEWELDTAYPLRDGNPHREGEMDAILKKLISFYKEDAEVISCPEAEPKKDGVVTGVLVRAKERTAEVFEIGPNQLESLYSALNTDVIDHVKRKIGRHYYDVILDDEGLYREEQHVSMINADTFKPMLVGNIFICRHDDRGEMISLTKDEIEEIIKSHIARGILARF